MENVARLSRKIRTAHDLLSVVKTMKGLAAVNIRHFESAARSMDKYSHIIEIGWQALLRNNVHMESRTRSSAAVCLVIGSDQGMCGQFNDAVVRFATEHIDSLKRNGIKIHYWTAGERVRVAFDEVTSIEHHFALPSSTDAIGDLMLAMVHDFADLHEVHHIETFVLYFNRLGRGGAYEPVAVQVLPLDAQWSRQKKEAVWPSRCLPVVGMEVNDFFKHIFQEHLFALIYRAFAQSLACENGARLSAMMAAEKNILELEEKLQGKFRENRQSAITAELLDIISGFEALTPH
ncbi:F0F1 ATP synthase subunit gamma [Desulfopila sp. IMCC35006]|uniref:F0F1 ATP synthase subunit gamma n=1 Tax=Desulfopila sp. IMCC35006 TaxID=2569542 RepID=UPI00142ECD1E|nr:F0F1 ATP synthase subunit gamma [Desulfopila sp. IMCC35006]